MGVAGGGGPRYLPVRGGGDPERNCALLGREVDDTRYSGFWTTRSDLVNPIGEYVSETYIL